jgi:hypothetical protein
MAQLKSFMRRFIEFTLRSGAASVCLAVALMLSGQRAQAQAVISNATSVASLQNALVNGYTNISLAFSGTMSTTAPLEIVEDVTIDGTGFSPVISGGGTSQIFIVDPGINFRLINVTLSGGNNTGAAGIVGTAGGNGGNTGGNGGSGTGGTNAFGGAVFNQGISAFINCLFLTNGATGGAGGSGGNGGNGNNTGGAGGNGGNGGLGQGGAIYNLGTLLVSNCTIAGNTAAGGAGGTGGTNGSGPFASYPGAGGAGGGGAGAGIYNAGQATIVNTTLNQNASLGGTSQNGGGPTGSSQNGGPGANGGNSMGGGIFNAGTNALINCTFFANNATGGIGGDGGNGNTNGLSTGGTGGNGGNAFGGGVYNAPGGLVAITNCTITADVVTGGTNGIAGFGNFAGRDGSVGSVAGANLYNGNTGATFRLKNSILDFPTNAASASGTITDQGNNISSDATPAFNTTNSFNNKDPKLSPAGLQSNNSATVLTIGLSANSPAIDAIYDNSAPPYDERSFPRPGGLRSDIGAYEFGVFTTNFNVSGNITLGGLPLGGVTVSVGTATSAVTDTNGNFEFSLAQSNSYVITPKPSGFFNPASANITVNGDINLLFNATNAAMMITNLITNVSGPGTNTNAYLIPFAGIPNFATYHIQGATNFLPTNTVWTNLATITFSNTVDPAFVYTNTGANLTNFHYFRAKLGAN